jgi:two-component sensor histidine kinase
VREKTISAILKIIKNQLNLSGQVLEAIYYFINELTQNVSDHSKADYGKIMAQYYNSKGYMDICIVDGGKGLFQSYLDNNKKFPISHSEAIEFAFSGESTKYSENDSSRGFGLQTSRRMLVDGLEGQFFYWSGDAFLMNKGDIGNLPYWKGCYAGLRIPISEPKGFNFYNFLE